MQWANEESITKKLVDDCRKLNDSRFENNNYCKFNFDGLMCWPYTKAGEMAFQNCSNEFIGSLSNGLASKYCTSDGTWYFNGKTNYTNYTECENMYFKLNIVTYNEWLPILKNISYFGYAVSIISLIAALFIFICIKRLHCSRNKLHINLFMSFLMRGFMFLLKDALFIGGTVLMHEADYENGKPIFIRENYSWLCKAFTSLRFYFILSNFMWILMEGMYLHNLMFLNLFSDNNGVMLYCGLGWGLPIFFLIPWIILKKVYEDSLCWTEKSSIYLLIDIPIWITIVINFILFLLIIRVLFLKLNTICIQQRKIKYRKLLKSTLILIPIFGIPYCISLGLSFFVEKSQTVETTFLIFDQSFSAYQGLFAALIYCLLNNEVQIEIKRKYYSMKDRNNREFRRSRTISHTQQFSIPLNDDNVSENHYFSNNEDMSKKCTECYF